MQALRPAFIHVVAFLILSISTTVRAQDFGHPSTIMPIDGNRLASMRMAGLTGDRTSIPALIRVLEKPGHQYDLHTALHSLAQLKAIEALPAIDKVIQQANDVSIRNFAQIIRARLLAEDETKTLQNPQNRAITKVQRFLDLLGVNIRT